MHIKGSSLLLEITSLIRSYMDIGIIQRKSPRVLYLDTRDFGPPQRSREKPATERIYQAMLLLASLPFFLMACDGFYSTRGVVSGVIEDQDARRSSINHLKDAEIRIYYVGREGSIGLWLNNSSFTDQEGKYRISFTGPPGELDRGFFLEFKKPGYELKKVTINDDSKDPNVTIKRCPGKTGYTGCWIIDVILTPESK